MIKNNLSLQPRRKRDRRRMKIETDCKMQINNNRFVTDYELEDNACILWFGIMQDAEEVDEDGEN